MAVAANGQPGPVTALLPAPSAQSLPSLYEDAQWLDIPLPAMPQAQGWLVGISSDAQGHKVLRNAQVQGQQARFAALPDGSYYLHVRALDLYGISGLPRTVPIRVKAHPYRRWCRPLHRVARWPWGKHSCCARRWTA